MLLRFRVLLFLCGLLILFDLTRVRKFACGRPCRLIFAIGITRAYALALARTLLVGDLAFVGDKQVIIVGPSGASGEAYLVKAVDADDEFVATAAEKPTWPKKMEFLEAAGSC